MAPIAPQIQRALSSARGGYESERRHYRQGGTDALKGGGSLTDKAKTAATAIKDPGARGEKEHKEKPEGERHPAKHAGHPSDTPRKGGPPHS